MAGTGHSVSGSGLRENPITHGHRTHGIKILRNYFSRITRIKKKEEEEEKEEEEKATIKKREVSW